MNDNKTFLNYHLTNVLDDLSDMIKNSDLPFEAYYQPLRQIVDLLNQGASVNTQNKRGETLLHLACYSADPLYGVETISLRQKLKNVNAFLKDMYACTKITGELLFKGACFPFHPKLTKADVTLLALKLKHVATKYQRRGPKEVFLPIEKIITTYHPNPFLVDKRMNTPAMALATKLRSPLLIEKNKTKLTEDQMEHKYAELNILDAYSQSFQAQQTARALKGLMTLSALTDKEKTSLEVAQTARDVVYITEHAGSRLSRTTTERAERLITTIIQATNRLSGIHAAKSNPNTKQNGE